MDLQRYGSPTADSGKTPSKNQSAGYLMACAYRAKGGQMQAIVGCIHRLL